MADHDTDDQCRIMTEVALRQAIDECGSEEAVREQVRRILGMNGDIDPNCSQTLSTGLNMTTLTSTRKTREWVFCRSWELVKEEDKSLSEAVEKAWTEAHKAGEDHSIEV